MNQGPSHDLTRSQFTPLQLIERLMRGRLVGPHSKVWVENKLGSDIPSIPANLLRFLSSACPIRGNGEQVMRTHFLTLLPAQVGNQPYTVKSMHYHLSNVMAADPTRGYYPPEIFMTDRSMLNIGQEFEDLRIPKSTWILQYDGILPGTEKLNYTQALQVLGRRPLYRQASLIEHIGTMALQLAENNQLSFPDVNAICSERQGDFLLYASNSASGGGILPGHMHVQMANGSRNKGLAVVVDLSKL